MKSIVTGAAGFIGSHVAEVLVRQGHEVLAIDDLSGGFLENVPRGACFERRSVVDGLDDLFGTFKPEAVYHLAAYGAEGLSHHIPVFTFMNHVVATANVLSASYRAGARHFVYASSIAVYGHPRTDQPFDESSPCLPCDPYGTAKLACEHHIRAAYEYFGRPDFTIFRPHNVFGPRQNVSDPYRNVVGIFLAKAIERAPLPVFGDGKQTRSFSYISTVARCIAAAPEVPAARNGTFNVGSDESMSVNDLARQVVDTIGVTPRIQYLPSRQEVAHAHCSHQLARRIFAESYVDHLDIAAGLREMAEYVKARPLPSPSRCPTIEIADRLPPSWAVRQGRDALPVR